MAMLASSRASRERISRSTTITAPVRRPRPGGWRRTRRIVLATAAIWLVAGVAWIDHSRTSTWLYPGQEEPSVSLPSRGPMEVPVHLRSRLVATFNGGFKLKDFGGGFAVGGHTYAAMKPALATFVRYKS